MSTKTAGPCHGTAEASMRDELTLGPEMIHEVLEVMTDSAKEGVR